MMIVFIFIFGLIIGSFLNVVIYRLHRGEKFITGRSKCLFCGHKLYINCLRKATAVIGNSSSGVIEAPIVGVPSVNIGNRQQGRIMTKSTITSKSNKKDIIFSIKKAMNFSKEQNITHPFGDGKTSTQIVSLIKKHLNKKNNNIKKFYDLKF